MQLNYITRTIRKILGHKAFNRFMMLLFLLNITYHVRIIDVRNYIII